MNIKDKNELNEYQKINKRKRVSIVFEGKGRTQQNLKDEVDINNIVKRYQVSGEVPEQREGYYADVSKIPNYQQALDIVSRAEDAFNSLPAKVRGRFMNNPGMLLEWLEKPENRAEAIELGLLEGDTSKQPQLPKGDVKKETETKVEVPSTEKK